MASSLSVTVAISGTATRDADYTLSGSGIAGGTRLVATIPAGVASTIVTLKPLQDFVYEGTENAVMSVLGGSAYSLGSETRAVVRILDNDPAVVSSTSASNDELAQMATALVALQEYLKRLGL